MGNRNVPNIIVGFPFHLHNKVQIFLNLKVKVQFSIQQSKNI